MKPVILFVELKLAAKNKYICEIAEKLYHNKISVCIYSPENFTQIDHLLWTWKQESFIPHQIYSNINKNLEPVIISNSQESLASSQAIILNNPLPSEYLLKYNLIIDFAEIYRSDKKEESRQRFKKLRDTGEFDIHFSQLGAILAKKSISLNFAS